MTFNQQIKVGRHLVSPESPVFLIAEAGVNHGGDMGLARQLIDIAAEAGVQAVKFQSFKTEHLIIKGVAKAEYQQKTTGQTEDQYEMLRKLEITQDQTMELKRYCEACDLIFLTTPFDEYSLNLLDDLDVDAYKVSSTDVTNLSFLKEVAGKGKPVFLSTGMTYLTEVEMALREMTPLNQDIMLMQCTANYPIRDDEANLSVIGSYRESFGVLSGYSDHTVGVGAAPYAVAAGAKFIEKHFTLDKSLPGPDHKASLGPEELKAFVREVRRAESFMGSPVKKPTISELNTRKSLQKCLVARTPIKKGDTFSLENIQGKRTGGVGIPALYYREVVDRASPRDFAENEIISLD